MFNIPQKVITRFKSSVNRYQKILKTSKVRDVNESDTVAIITDILADVFGYDKYLEVTSEFAIRGTYCDLAIKIEDKVQFLIEVKAIGIDLKENHLKQAIDYGANQGIQWVVLTNGIEWKLYKIRFEKPINYDLVCSFDFLEISPKEVKSQEVLFLLAKEGLNKDACDNYYERVLSVNKYIISGLLLHEPVLSVVRRELRKYADGVKVDIDEIRNIIQNDVLKREVLEADEAKSAQSKIDRYYKKESGKKTKKQVKRAVKEIKTKTIESDDKVSS